MSTICSEDTKDTMLEVSHSVFITTSSSLFLDLSNDYYPDHHKLEVILFKSDRTAIASLSDSLKQQQVPSEVSASLLLASTKHRQNIIIQNHHLSPIRNLLQKAGRDNSSWNMGCYKSYFIMDLITITTQLLLFSVKEFLSEVIILGPTGRAGEDRG